MGGDGFRQASLSHFSLLLFSDHFVSPMTTILLISLWHLVVPLNNFASMSIFSLVQGKSKIGDKDQESIPQLT